MVLRERRFGEIGPELDNQLRSLTTAQLEELGVAVLDFQDKSELADWIQKAGNF